MQIELKDKAFGSVISISGLNITIAVFDEFLISNLEIDIVKNDGTKKFYIGTVGDIFLIGGPTTHDAIHYGMFEEVKLVPDEKDLSKNKALITAKVIGYQNAKVTNELKFNRGVGHYPKFNSKCYILSSEEKQQLFSLTAGEGICVGKVPGIQNEDVNINIEKFLGKHSVILGSTGSGKSCTVASILQKTLQAHLFSHIIFFDLHNEYSAAFPTIKTDLYNGNTYNVNKVDANNFTLPFWFLNFEEFQSIFLGDIDYAKNGEGIRILREEVIKLKVKSHNLIMDDIGEIERININSPLHFDFSDLVIKLKKLNKSTLWKSDGASTYNESTGNYVANSGASKVDRDGTSDQALQDPNYYDKLHSVIEKLESTKLDRRYQFLFPESYITSKNIYEYLISLLCLPKDHIQNQMTILDLSKIPSEIIPIIIGLLSRICFEYKLWEVDPKKLPLYLVYEEAHNYIPNDVNAITALSSKYIGRIAKEGRKYGISQLIISQRPSDLSQLIVSQCSNFFILRVTNPNDQAFINHVLPDHLSALSNMIPFFQNGECLIAGELVTIPTKVIIDRPAPEPNSNDVAYSKTWKKILIDYKVQETVHKWWEIKE